MSDPVEKYVWFMRHGKPDFDYDTRNYDKFISMLTNGHRTPLVKEHNIDFSSLPRHADLVCFSPALRSIQTVGELKKRVSVEEEMEMRLLDEVKFNKTIIREEEFVSLEKSRHPILSRWYRNANKAELFEQSVHRVKQIELFLSTRSEKNIIIVTHGWLLRLLIIYFVQGKREGIALANLLEAPRVNFGQVVRASIKAKYVDDAATTSNSAQILNSLSTPQTASHEHLMLTREAATPNLPKVGTVAGG